MLAYVERLEFLDEVQTVAGLECLDEVQTVAGLECLDDVQTVASLLHGLGRAGPTPAETDREARCQEYVDHGLTVQTVIRN